MPASAPYQIAKTTRKEEFQMTKFAWLFGGLLCVGSLALGYLYNMPVLVSNTILFGVFGYWLSELIPWRKPNFTATNVAYLGFVSLGGWSGYMYYQLTDDLLTFMCFVCLIAFISRWAATLFVNWNHTWLSNYGNREFFLTLLIASSVGGFFSPGLLLTSSQRLTLAVAEPLIMISFYLFAVSGFRRHKGPQFYLWTVQFLALATFTHMLLIWISPPERALIPVATIIAFTQLLVYLLTLAMPWSASPARLPSQMERVKV